MTYAYSPSLWIFVEDVEIQHLCRYPHHLIHNLNLAVQCAIAGMAGFTHAFIAWLVPFVAEEVGTELATIIEAKRGKHFYELNMGTPYAFRPHNWVWFLDGWKHVKFSGGSYTNHGRFACWASAQFMIAACLLTVHASVPFLFPRVGEQIAFELGTLIKNRRRLRNAHRQQNTSK